jgi:microcystin degradation protein MlrC
MTIETQKRVAMGAFSIECNSFARGRTTLEDFKAQVFFLGDAANAHCAGPETEFAAAWDVLAKAEFQIIPTAVACSSPRPPVAKEALDVIFHEIVWRIPVDIDGVYLALHGSAYCHEDEDPEGTLLEMIREKIGPRKPIAISLDLHAYFSAKMLASVDIAVAYRSCPHLDIYDTGKQVAQILVKAVNGEVQPLTVMAARPMMTPPELHSNALEPYGSLMAACRAEEKGEVLAVSLLTIQPWIDVCELGWKAIVVVNADRDLGKAVANKIIEMAWNVRHELTKTSALSPIVAFNSAFDRSDLCIIADLGDATNGGSVGDSTEILRIALASNAKGRLAISITDPESSLLAHSKEIGQLFDFQLGFGGLGEYNELTAVRAKILEIRDEKIQYTSPAAQGVIDDPGPSALLQIVNIENSNLEIFVVIHTYPVRVIDPAIYLLVGLDLNSFDVIQAKSHVSFKPGFAPLTNEFELASTIGPTTADLKTLNFTRRPVPLFPFEDI